MQRVWAFPALFALLYLCWHDVRQLARKATTDSHKMRHYNYQLMQSWQVQVSIVLTYLSFGVLFSPAGATNNRSDRIAQALSASAESIGAAVSGRSDATTAAQKSKAFARMAARDGTAASEFGGK